VDAQNPVLVLGRGFFLLDEKVLSSDADAQKIVELSPFEKLKN
jgi:hypothetical protein